MQNAWCVLLLQSTGLQKKNTCKMHGVKSYSFSNGIENKNVWFDLYQSGFAYLAWPTPFWLHDLYVFAILRNATVLFLLKSYSFSNGIENTNVWFDFYQSGFAYLAWPTSFCLHDLYVFAILRNATVLFLFNSYSFSNGIENENTRFDWYQSDFAYLA
jgi:hypothetical protein